MSGTVSQRASTCSGAPFTTSTRPTASSTSAEVALRVWSNGSIAMRFTPAMPGRPCHNAASSSLAPTPPIAGSTSEASSPERNTDSECLPAGSTASRSVIRPSVRVPVLSVIKMSMSPRSSMHTSRLTSTLSRASRREPDARLVLTTAGSSCGVIPTAMARPNSKDSITGRRSSRLVTMMTTVSVIATRSSRYEKRRNPIWKSVSGWRSPSPAAMRPN